MNNKIIIISLMFISFLWSDYSIEEAYPNLTFIDPVGIYYPNDNTDRIFVLEQEGRIKVFNNNMFVETDEVFLDIRSMVDQDGGYTEEGLLGFAFHPNYSENGFFYVNYTRHNPRRNVIARYNVSENLNEADYQSSSIILEVNQPYTNHNGGQMGFGPDGYLYISFGDGGGAGDPDQNGQDLSTLLGTMIRIDIDNPSNELNYGIPADNPFTIPLAARDEIYAYGLRNMWKFSWDLETGLLWGADVGQNAYEEIDIIYSGLNYGWNTMEGNHCYPIGSNCSMDGLEPPILEYELYVDGVCSITGGYVYRGSDLYGLIGKYIYGDWCTGDIWALTYDGTNNITNEHLLTTGINITSFGLDQFNELLFCGNNKIYRMISNLGDLNGDNSIDVLDVITLVNHILSPSTDELDGADINNDGEANVLDIITLVNIILN